MGFKYVGNCVMLLIVSGLTLVVGSAGPPPKPYILHIEGSCSPGEMSVEYFITGPFGGYSGFVKTDARFYMYEIPTVRDGMTARSLKIIIRGARCRTQTFDIPDVDRGARVIRARLRRSRSVEFRGVITSPEMLPKRNARLTVEYWAHWKCDFFGIPDCLLGPTRIDAVDVGEDGKFRVRLPDLLNDHALSEFNEKGEFQFFIRERGTGKILFNLQGSDELQSIPVAGEYPPRNEFSLEPSRLTLRASETSSIDTKWL